MWGQLWTVLKNKNIALICLKMSVVAVWIPVCESVKYLRIRININEMPAVWNWDIQQWIRLFNRTCWKRYNFLLIHHKMSQKSLVLGELSFASMPLRYYWLKMNGLQFWNCLPKLVHCSQWQPWGVVTQDGKTKILKSLEMFNFDIYVVESAFGTILGDPKFGSFHVGSPHLMAVTGHSWLTLVGNSNNEVCSPSNNTVLKAFWQKKVLPEQRISYFEGIYKSNMLPPIVY